MTLHLTRQYQGILLLQLFHHKTSSPAASHPMVKDCLSWKGIIPTG